jgi:hypothetical protein
MRGILEEVLAWWASDDGPIEELVERQIRADYEAYQSQNPDEPLSAQEVSKRPELEVTRVQGVQKSLHTVFKDTLDARAGLIEEAACDWVAAQFVCTELAESQGSDIMDILRAINLGLQHLGSLSMLRTIVSGILENLGERGEPRATFAVEAAFRKSIFRHLAGNYVTDVWNPVEGQRFWKQLIDDTIKYLRVVQDELLITTGDFTGKIHQIEAIDPKMWQTMILSDSVGGWSNISESMSRTI